jgi:hypothetical protein
LMSPLSCGPSVRRSSASVIRCCTGRSSRRMSLFGRGVNSTRQRPGSVTRCRVRA